MLNPNWYLVCDISTMKAMDLIQIPVTWNAVTGLEAQSDEDLENFYNWSPYKTISFLPISRAKILGIDSSSIDAVIAATKPAVLAWVRGMRDPLLKATDALTGVDRWNSLDVVNQNYVTVYRTQLRDITLQDDIFNITWPSVPKALDTIRGIDLSLIERPSVSFITALNEPTPAPSLAERQNNQWLRIKAERDRRRSGGVKVAVDEVDYWFWTDEVSRGQYSILDSFANRHSLPDSYLINSWKTMSGEFVDLTVTLLRKVIDTGIQIEGVVFSNAEAHRKAMLKADDPDTYDFSTGWPEIYSSD